MALAQEPIDHLDRLPDELILEIIEQPCLSVRDLISLARTSRRHYRITIPPAYKAHIKCQHGLAIYWAIENDQQGTLERLVEHGIDVNMREEQDDYACFTVEELLYPKNDFNMKACRLIANLENEAWVYPLAWAASRGRDSMVEYLLDHGADIEGLSFGLCTCVELLHCPHLLPKPPVFSMKCKSRSLDGICYPYLTPLHYAICNRKDSTAKLLLERGANASDLGYSDDEQVTALHLALRWGLRGTINYLLDKDLVDIHAMDTLGVTVLHVAHLACEYDLVNKLLDKGADINQEFYAESGPWTIFSMACAERMFDRALQYLRRGADPHFILEDISGDDFTVMRLIYFDASHLADEDRDERMRLELGIIASGRR